MARLLHTNAPPLSSVAAGAAHVDIFRPVGCILAAVGTSVRGRRVDLRSHFNCQTVKGTGTSNHYNRRLQKCLVLINYYRGDDPEVEWVVLGAYENYELLGCAPPLSGNEKLCYDSKDIEKNEAEKAQYGLMTE